jgi:hypothetical protein
MREELRGERVLEGILEPVTVVVARDRARGLRGEHGHSGDERHAHHQQHEAPDGQAR